MKNYEEIMRKHVASDKQMNSKTSRVFLEALAEEEGFVDACTRELAEKINDDVSELEKKQKRIQAEFTGTEKKIADHVENLSSLIERAEMVTIAGEDSYVKDPVAVEAVNIYKTVLGISVRVVRDATGKKTVSDEVIMKMIDAATSGMSGYLTNRESEPDVINSEW